MLFGKKRGITADINPMSNNKMPRSQPQELPAAHDHREGIQQDI
jgi:hypothetical protein